MQSSCSHFLGLYFGVPGLSHRDAPTDPCSPAKISASSMNWVLNRITRPARCSRRRLHTWCLERGSSPAVGSSRSKTCRKDGIGHSSLPEQALGFDVLKARDPAHLLCKGAVRGQGTLSASKLSWQGGL